MKMNYILLTDGRKIKYLHIICTLIGQLNQKGPMKFYVTTISYSEKKTYPNKLIERYRLQTALLYIVLFIYLFLFCNIIKSNANLL